MSADNDREGLQEFNQALDTIAENAEIYQEKCAQINPDKKNKTDDCWDARSSLSEIQRSYSTIQRLGLRNEEVRKEIEEEYGQGVFETFRYFLEGNGNRMAPCRSGSCGSTPDFILKALNVIENIKQGNPIGSHSLENKNYAVKISYGEENHGRGSETGFSPQQEQD